MVNNFAVLWPTDPKFSEIKDLYLFSTVSKAQEANRILRIDFALSKWPHLLHKMGFVDSLTQTTVLLQIKNRSVSLNRNCNLLAFDMKKRDKIGSSERGNTLHGFGRTAWKRNSAFPIYYRCVVDPTNRNCRFSCWSTFVEKVYSKEIQIFSLQIKWIWMHMLWRQLFNFHNRMTFIPRKEEA